MQALARAREAGLTGGDVRPSGLERPWFERLGRRSSVVVANGLEGEPLVASDRALLVSHAPAVLKGLYAAMEAVEAGEGIIVVPADDSELLQSLARGLQGQSAVRMMPVDERYPMALPSALTWQVTGRRVPPGGDPQDVGVLVARIHPLWHLAEALRGRPVTHRLVTVAGAVSRPQTLRVPIGLALAELVSICGGPLLEDCVLVEGGPLRGQVAAEDAVVSQGTRSVLVLPPDHRVSTRMTQSLEVDLKRAASVCAGCRRCTDLCPPHLMGYGIQPHLLMRGLVNAQAEQAEVVMGASSCLGCRLCEVTCPAGVSPGRLYQAIAGELRGRGLGTLPSASPGDAHTLEAFRQVPRAQVTERLGLSRYAGRLPIDDNYPEVSRVRVPLNGAEPLVGAGQAVAMGEVIGRCQGRDFPVHASIAGRVGRVEAGHVEIIRA